MLAKGNIVVDVLPSMERIHYIVSTLFMLEFKSTSKLFENLQTYSPSSKSSVVILVDEIVYTKK